MFAFKFFYALDIDTTLFGTDSYGELFQKYETLQRISFDYKVAEKEKSINVIRFADLWKDLATWNTLTVAMNEDVTGNTMTAGCENTRVINELGIPGITLEIKNAVVVATPDGVLVSDKEKSLALKSFVADARLMYERWGGLGRV